MSFGWSVGDIVQGISIGIKVVEALGSTRGAPSRYQEISSFLNNVQNTLEPLQNDSASEIYSSSKVEIENLVKAINEPLCDILKSIQKYDAKLGSQADPKWYKHAPQKLLWEFWASPNAKASRTIIEGHLNTLTLLLQRLTYDKINTLPTSANAAQITRDVLNLYDDEVVGQRHFEIMSLLGVIQQQNIRFKTEYLTPNLAVDGSDPPGYSSDNDEALHSTRTSAALQQYLTKLESYSQEEILVRAFQDAEEFCVEDRFARDISFWLQDLGGPWLWIQGPSSTDFSTMVCASILGAAREAQVPTLHYFCQQEVTQSATNITETELLLRLTYSIIYQIIKFRQFNPSGFINKLRGDFNRLDGTVSSVPESLEILRDLLGARSTDFLIIIDGVNLIDTTGGGEIGNQAYELLEILRQCNKSSVNQLSRSKVLLGTPGQTPLLEIVTEFNEQLDAMRSTNGALCLRTMLSADDFRMK